MNRVHSAASSSIPVECGETPIYYGQRVRSRRGLRRPGSFLGYVPMPMGSLVQWDGLDEPSLVSTSDLEIKDTTHDR